MQYGIIPTVPQYYLDFINPKVDLTVTPKQCCPFHREDTPSFSFDIRTGRWSCFGSCHAHGDVVEMHKRWMKLNSREEAEADLYAKYKVPQPSTEEKLERARDIKPIPQQEVNFEIEYVRACELARTPEDYVELDAIMAEYPVSYLNLKNFNIERMVRYANQ